MSCLQGPNPEAPWTHHAHAAQAAECTFDWRQASEQWQRAEQAAEVFGGADEAQQMRMHERNVSAQSIQTWLHEHERGGFRAVDWYLAEAGTATGCGYRALAHAMYRRAWQEAGRAWTRGDRLHTERLDFAIQMSRSLERELTLT